MSKINSKYWKERQKAYFKNLEKDEEKLLKKMIKEYEKEAAKLDKEIASYYAKYGTDNVIEYRDLLVELDSKERKILLQDMEQFFDVYPEFEHLKPIRESIYKLDRLGSLRYSITKQQIELGVKEEEVILKHLSKSYTSTYNAMLKNMGFGNNFLSVNDILVKDLVNRAWLNDKKFSDRIWGNKEKLIDYITTDFKNGIIRGDNYNKLSKILEERFLKQSKNNIKRLVYTEGTFIQNQAMAKPFEDIGYDTYIYDAILDDETSEVCEGLNGQEFLFKDKEPGVNFPPMHPWCRSSFIVKL